MEIEIQGVKILRISDLKRFFDLTEFWKKREDFVCFVTERTTSAFFDNDREILLYEILKKWLINEGDPLCAIFSDTYDEIKCQIGDNLEIMKMGRMFSDIVKVKGQMRDKDLIGLTLLYLLLGADDLNSDIPLEYEAFPAIRKMRISEGMKVVLCERSTHFEKCKFKLPISRVIISNNSEHPICVDNDSNVGNALNEKDPPIGFELHPGDCMLGLFHDNQCIEFFPNRVSQKDLTLKLVLDAKKKNPRLVQKRQSDVVTFSNVCCIGIVNDVGVYLTIDGQLHFDHDVCVGLKEAEKRFRREHPHSFLLAFKIEHECCYFYTERQKLSYFL